MAAPCVWFCDFFMLPLLMSSAMWASTVVASLWMPSLLYTACLIFRFCLGAVDVACTRWLWEDFWDDVESDAIPP